MSTDTQPFLMHIEEVFALKDDPVVVVGGRILTGSVRRGDPLRLAPSDPAMILTVGEEPEVNYADVHVASAPVKVSLVIKPVPAGAVRAGLILASVGATAADLEIGIQEVTLDIATGFSGDKRARDGSTQAADKAQRLRERGALHAANGNPREAMRDALEATYAAEAFNARRDYQPGQWVEIGASLAGMGGDAFGFGWALMGKKLDAKAVYNERLALFKTGLVAAVAYCKACRLAVVLDTDLRCPNSPKHPASQNILFVMPEQVPQAIQVAQARRK